MGDTKTLSATINANDSISSAVDLGTHSLMAFEMPETWTGTVLTFQAKAKPQQTGTGQVTEDWDDVYDSSGTELSVTVAANRVVGLTADKAAILAPIRHMRIRSGTAAAPAGQNPTKIIRLITKEI